MEYPHILYGIATNFPPHEHRFHHPMVMSQADESILLDTGTMHNIDPSLGSASPLGPMSGAWGQPRQVQRYLDDPQKTTFFNPPLKLPLLQQSQYLYQHHQSQHHQQLQHQENSNVTRPLAPAPPSQPRYGSPFSNQEPGSSCSSALSPPGDSELFHDNGPPTPPVPEYSSASPFKQPHSLACWGAPVQDCTANMSGYVNPFEVSQEPLADFDAAESNTAFDFSPLTRGFSLQSTSSTSYDYEPSAQSSAVGQPIDFAINKRMSTPADLPARVKDEITVDETPYPPPPSFDEDAGHDSEDQQEPSPQHKSATRDEGHNSNDNEEHKPSRIGSKALHKKPTSPTAASSRRSHKSKRSSSSLQSASAQERQPQPKRQKTSAAATTSVTATTNAAASATSTAAASRPARTSTQTQPSSSMPSSASASIVAGMFKTPLLSCRECGQTTTFKDEASLQAHIKRQHTRPFVCVFNFAGCESNFASKNEWKRHVSSQHLLLHYWLCTVDACAKTTNSTGVAASSSASSRSHHPHLHPHLQPGSQPQLRGSTTTTSLRGRNSSTISSLAAAAALGEPIAGPPLPNGAIFNRKDLFTQHVRRMHTSPKIKKLVKDAAASAVASTASSTGAGASGSSKKKPVPPPAKVTASATAELADWEDKVRSLQADSERERCQLPTSMSCPANGCNAHFKGADAWDQRMEHVAKHLEAAGKNEEPLLVFGGDSDPTLMAWAARPDVAIVVPAVGGAGGRGSGSGSGSRRAWALNNPLKPAAAPAGAAGRASTALRGGSTQQQQQQQQQQPTMVLGEIVVESGDDDEDADADADGEGESF